MLDDTRIFLCRRNQDAFAGLRHSTDDTLSHLNLFRPKYLLKQLGAGACLINGFL
jgi:hypothetical protein